MHKRAVQDWMEYVEAKNLKTFAVLLKDISQVNIFQYEIEQLEEQMIGEFAGKRKKEPHQYCTTVTLQ